MNQVGDSGRKVRADISASGSKGLLAEHPPTPTPHWLAFLLSPNRHSAQQKNKQTNKQTKRKKREKKQNKVYVIKALPAFPLPLLPHALVSPFAPNPSPTSQPILSACGHLLQNNSSKVIKISIITTNQKKLGEHRDWDLAALGITGTPWVVTGWRTVVLGNIGTIFFPKFP